MENLDYYRSMSHRELLQEPLIKEYEDMLSGTKKVLSKGTWQSIKNVIVIYRYVLEIKLKLCEQEIPKITRDHIKKYKLWGSITRYKTIKDIIHLVYPNQYNEFDFHRVPKDYWSDNQKIRSRIEHKLSLEGYSIQDIPSVVTCEKLIEWGLSNPLKRWDSSSYRLMNALYANLFKPTEFRKSPQRSSRDKQFLIKQFEFMLEKEKIALHEIPKKVTQELLNKYRFTATLKHFNNSPSRLIMFLYPNQFLPHEFHTQNYHWHDENNVRTAIEKLLRIKNISFQEIQKYFTKQFFKDNGLYGLIQVYHSSPIELVMKLYPGQFVAFDFQRVPNRFWYKRENRIQALRDYCYRHQIGRDQLSKLTRSYFKKHFPRFISLVDRHYESKFYLWVEESFPEYTFAPEEFNLLVGLDGQVCDSKEELEIHNFLLERLQTGFNVKRESIRFLNQKSNEVYIPDWFIQKKQKKFIIEYFGLYGSTRYPGYTEKVKRKIEFYKGLNDYIFISIMPDDFKSKNFEKIDNLLNVILENNYK